MKFILIVAFLTGHYNGGSQGIVMQEFNSRETCIAAGERSKELATSLPGGARKNIAFDCKPK
jgi:hypothetical protein